MQKRVGKYELIEKVGSGTAGVVYRAEDPDIGRSVAIKILKAEYFGSASIRSQAVERFQSEIRAIGRLAHPNIVSIYDSGITSDGLPFLVMQYVEGRGLDLILRDSGGSLPPERALQILSELADALDYAHGQEVIHRDIKPSNILIGADERVFIVDFSTAIVDDDQATPEGQVVGTPQFMAPEVIRGERPTTAADLYSLGIIAFLLFTGKKPFREGGIATTFTATLKQSAFSFAELGCPLGAKLERVLRRALAKNPDDRFVTAIEFIDACKIALKGTVHTTFSQVAPAADQHAASSSGSFKFGLREPTRRQTYDRALSFRAMFLVVLFVLSIGFSSATFILYGLEKDSQIAMRLRGQSGIGYAEADIRSLASSSLIRILGSKMPVKTMRAAIKESVRRNSVELANTVHSILSDPRAEVRTEAIRAVVVMNSLSTGMRNDALRKGLEDQDPFIRIYAASELMRLLGKSERSLIEKQREKEKDPMAARVFDAILQKR